MALVQVVWVCPCCAQELLVVAEPRTSGGRPRGSRNRPKGPRPGEGVKLEEPREQSGKGLRAGAVGLVKGGE